VTAAVLATIAIFGAVVGAWMPGTPMGETGVLLGLSMLWYAVSIGLTLLNKYLCMSACHLFLQFITAAVLMQFRTKCKQCGAGTPESARAMELQRRLFEPMTFAALALPVGAATAADIGLSNWSVTRIPVAIYTVAKGSSVVFNLLFSMYLGYQRCFPSVVAIVMLIFCGIVMTSWSDDMHHPDPE